MAAWILNVLLAAAGAVASHGGDVPRITNRAMVGEGAINAAAAAKALPDRGPLAEAQAPLHEKPSPASKASLEASVRQALRRWAGVTDERAHLAAGEFLELYRKLRADRSLAPSTRTELQMKVRGRLVRLAEQISRHHAQQARSASGLSAKPTMSGARAVRLPPDRPTWLGQAGPGGWGPGNRQQGQPPAALGPAGNVGVPDYGPALVDLIQRTIAPDSWDIRGGPGSIYYWRPGRAVVVRHTTEVHEAVEDALGQLRNADP